MKTRLASVGDEEVEIGVSKNLLLRKPLRDEHVGGGVLHLTGLPLPDDPLLQFSEQIFFLI